MRQMLSLLRLQSTVLVDIFAASFLFVFVAFLALYTQFLMSVEKAQNPSPGGLKAVDGIPFTYQTFIDGFMIHRDRWKDEDFIELRGNGIVVYTRTYPEPKSLAVDDPKQIAVYLGEFLDEVARNFDRLGPPLLATGAEREKPIVAIYVLDSRHYYLARDVIQEREFGWSEFAVPGGSDNGTIAGDGSGAVDADAFVNEWTRIIDEIARLHDTEPPETTPELPAVESGVITLSPEQLQWLPIEALPITDKAITIVLLNPEAKVEPRNWLAIVLAVIVAVLVAAEVAPALRRKLALRRFRRSAAGVGW